MARINIEDSLWKDDRFQDLMIRVGNRHTAKGMLVELWSLAQEYWFPKKQLIPRDRVKRSGLDILVEVGLAEEREGGVFAVGTEKAFDWLFQRKEAGKRGGRPKSAETDRLTTESGRQAAVSDSNPLTLSLTPTLKKEEREPLSQEILEGCVEAWGQTLGRLGVKKKPELDQEQIARLLQRHGYEKTKLALLGAGLEERSGDYDPKKHVSILRLQKPAVFETFVNLGAQLDSGERQTTKWDLDPC